MGYSLSLPLKKNSPIDEIEKVLLESKHIKDYVYISKKFDEHSYSVPYEKAIYASYSRMAPAQRYYLFFVFEAIAELYGIQICSPLDKEAYPFYNYDNEFTLLMTREQYKKQSTFEFYSADGEVISDDDAENLWQEIEEKQREGTFSPEEYPDLLHFVSAVIPEDIDAYILFEPESDRESIKKSYYEVQELKKSLLEKFPI